MARAIRPVASSARKVYVDRSGKKGTPVTFAPSAGGVQFVNEKAQATEVVSLYVGGNRVDRATAKKLTKAALESQKRQARGKDDQFFTKVFDDIIEDFGRPPTQEAKPTTSRGLSFRTALACGALAWIGLCVFIMRDSFGVGLLALFAVVLAAPAFAMVIKFFDTVVPEIGWIGAVGVVILSWGFGLGILDAKDPGKKRGPAGAGQSMPATNSADDGDRDSLASGQQVEPAPEVDPASTSDDWPKGASGYSILIASKASRKEAERFVTKARRQGLDAGALRSDNFTTLLPGYWVAFVGRYPSLGHAKNALESVRSAGFADAYVREISAEPQEPGGVLTTTGVGSVTIGMTTDTVSRYLTQPDDVNEVSFGGGGPPPEVDWVWRLTDGDFTLEFNNESGRLARFVTESTAHTTTSGLTIGDSFAPIRKTYGDQLRRSPIADNLYMLSDGRPGTFPALAFIVESGTITSISGGLAKPAGE